MPIRVLVLRGCLMEMGMSNEWAVTTAVAAPAVVGLSHFTLSQTKFLVTGRDRLGGSCEDRIQESMSISSRTRTGQVIPPRNRGTDGMTVVP